MFSRRVVAPAAQNLRFSSSAGHSGGNMTSGKNIADVWTYAAGGITLAVAVAAYMWGPTAQKLYQTSDDSHGHGHDDKHGHGKH
jgi:hypothetical protein